MSDPVAVSRRLVAVFAADVEGYSRLMGTDEVGTLKGLTERRAILDRIIGEHRGRIANTAGDSVLAEFGSAVDAVQCAVEAQAALAEANSGLAPDRRISFRIGIHIGDVMVRAGDLFGDGVNIAARLETLAKPGGVCVSGATYDQVRKVLLVPFTDLGVRHVKNIPEPIQVYEVGHFGATHGHVSRPPREEAELLPLPNKPSLAVLPFQNMSGDPEQEYFADGIVEDIITALSRFKSLFVIARNSSFTYKGRAIDIKQVGRELGVRYVLEGSVRKAGGRVRIAGQLIDSTTGTHLWADRFEGKLEDVFELQDQVATSVVGELVTEVQFAEMERATRKPTASLDAYDCYLRGLSHLFKFSKNDAEVALGYFLKALELDENFAPAYAWAGLAYVLRAQNGWMVDAAQESAEAIHLARRAIELGQLNDLALCVGGMILASIGGELDLGAECISRGLSMNANLAIGWEASGFLHIGLGMHQTALEHLRRAERLSPRGPSMTQVKLGMAAAHFYSGQYEEAARLAERITRAHPTFAPAWRIMAVSNALGGDQTIAAEATKQALQLDPSQRISSLTWLPLRRAQDRDRWKEALLRAGFPQ
jgi:TolB-like protein/class 3 adenylate cyclase